MGYGNLANPNGYRGPARASTSQQQIDEADRQKAGVVAANAPLPPTPPTPTGFDQDRADAQRLYQMALQQMQTAGNYQPPSVQAGQSSGANAVSYNAPGAVQQVQAPTAQAMGVEGANINQAADQQDRTAQLSYLQALQAQANGTGGPSPAELQLQQQMGQIAATQSGLAAQAHGNQGVFARRQAMQNTATQQQAENFQAAQLRAQEQLAAQQQLSTALSGMRASDQGISTEQAQLNQAAQIANAQNVNQGSQFNATTALQAGTTNAAAANAQAQQTAQEQLAAATTNAANQQNNAQYNATARQAASTSNAGNALQANNQNITAKQNAAANAQGAVTTEQTSTQGAAQTNLGQQGINLASRTANQNFASNIVGDVLKGAGDVGAVVSDRRSKEDIEPDSERVDALLRALRPYAYDYKDPSEPGARPGRQHGVMAQDLERSAIGRSVVRDTPSGKMVDTGRLTMALAGALAEVAADVRKLQAGRR